MTDWDRVHRINYESTAFLFYNWIGKAKALIESAKLIEPEVIRYWENSREELEGKTNKHIPDYYIGPYFMLIAFALENLLKAAIIRGNSYEYKMNFRRSLSFPKELKKHDLVYLAKKVEIRFTMEEEDLLRRLTRSAIWYGRYPIPLDYKKTSGAETFSDGKEYSVSWFGFNDVARLNKFINDLILSLDIQDIWIRS